MQIQVLSTIITQGTTKAGKPYDILDLAFKNLTFQGKVEGKKIMPFGGNANAFAALKNAAQGSIFDIQVVKNDQGYNDWVSVTPSEGNAPQTPAPSNTPASVYSGNAVKAAPARTSTYETPEERAAKQVYIVRQSSISSAVAALSVGSKSALKASDVIDFARELESFVFNGPVKGSVQDESGFDNMTDDVPL